MGVHSSAMIKYAVWLVSAFFALGLIEFATRVEVPRNNLWDIKTTETFAAGSRQVRVQARVLDSMPYNSSNYIANSDGDALFLSVYLEGLPFRILHFWKSRPLDCVLSLPKGVNRIMLGPEKQEIWPTYKFTDREIRPKQN